MTERSAPESAGVYVDQYGYVYQEMSAKKKRLIRAALYVGFLVVLSMTIFAIFAGMRLFSVVTDPRTISAVTSSPVAVETKRTAKALAPAIAQATMEEAGIPEPVSDVATDELRRITAEENLRERGDIVPN